MRYPRPDRCRRAALTRWIALGLAVSACTRSIPAEVTIARPATRPDSALVWWQALEECAGKTGDLSAVSWMSVSGYVVEVEGRGYDGYWLKDRNAVVFGEEQLAAANRRSHIIRHELLHALLKTDGHPPEYFGRKCRRLIVPER